MMYTKGLLFRPTLFCILSSPPWKGRSHPLVVRTKCYKHIRFRTRIAKRKIFLGQVMINNKFPWSFGLYMDIWQNGWKTRGKNWNQLIQFRFPIGQRHSFVTLGSVGRRDTDRWTTAQKFFQKLFNWNENKRKIFFIVLKHECETI